MTARELLERLNLLDENERIEAKAGSAIGKSLMETVCAFANEPGLGGGWLFLGAVRDELALLPSYEVVGLEQPDKCSADLASQAASLFDRPVRLDIQTEEVDGKPVIVVFVPEASPQDKPVHLKAQGLPRGAFRRIGSTDQRCIEDDLAVLYQDRRSESFEMAAVPDATLEDFSDEAIEDYRRSRREVDPNAEELGWSDEDLLQALGGTRASERGGRRPTVAGLLLFGTDVALRRSLPMVRVDYIRVSGTEWIPDPERRFDSLELKGPLLRVIRRAQAAVLDDLPKAFGLAEGDLQRTDTPVVPQRVIREAIVNALMHRSYRTHSPIQIIRYSNRLEIRNAGHSLKSPEHLGEPGSLLRNPKLATALYDTRFAETKGSGIRVMREMCERAGLTPPLFESDRGREQFVVRLFFHHFLGPGDMTWLARFKDLQLSDAEARALIVLREAGAMDNATWRDINKVDTLTASQSLRRLREAGLLERQGRGSATWYSPGDRMTDSDMQARGGLADSSSTPPSLPVGLDGLSTRLDGLSSRPDGLSTKLAPGPDGLETSSNGTREDERSDLLNELPDELAARIARIGQRHSPEAIRELVIELCRHRDYRAEELGRLLARKIGTVRHDYLRPLLRDERIAMTRPEQPSAPRQAYRTVEKRP